MKTYIHVRLNPEEVRQDLYEDAGLRAKVFSQKVRQHSLADIRKLAMRRASRKKPVPPYVPFVIAVDTAVADKLRQLPNNASVSALAQHFLR